MLTRLWRGLSPGLFREVSSLKLNIHSTIVKYYLKTELKQTGLAAYNIDYLNQIDTEQTTHLRYFEFLKQQLRKHPYWAKGHLEFAQLCLFYREISLAYASCLAVNELAPNSKLYLRKAKIIQARCFLSNNENDKAILLLKKLAKHSAEAYIKEELAAAYLAAEDLVAAEKTLLDIPEDRLSPTGKSALEYLSYKKTNV